MVKANSLILADFKFGIKNMKPEFRHLLAKKSNVEAVCIFFDSKEP